MRLRTLTAAVGTALAAVLLAGCGDTTSVVDAGAVAGAPPMPVTLWNAPKPTASASSPEPFRFGPVPGLRLPPGGDLRGLPAQDVIAKDPNLSQEAKQSVKRCRPGSGCGLRRPEFRDLTGDGKPELLMLIDPDPRLKPADDTRTLCAYWSYGNRVYEILNVPLQGEAQVDLQERDLVIRETRAPDWPGSAQEVVTFRCRWNPKLRHLEQISAVIAPVASTPPPKKPLPPSA